VDEDRVETDGVEQAGRVVRPAFDRVLLAGMIRGAVPAGVEREQAEALPEAVVDEAEVVASEESAAELEDDGRVLGSGQFVVEPDAVVDQGVGRAGLLVRAAGRLSPTSCRLGSS
jgi:hypothetical protein